MDAANSPHIVVVGAGFGGLQLIRDLDGAKVRITLIDQRNHHLFQPLLYQVATTILSTSEIAWPIRNLFRDRAEVTTLLGTVIDVDTARKSVFLENGDEVSYDMLVLATGARHAYFGNDQWEKLAPGLKALEDATTIRRRLLLAFERAEREPEMARRQALLTFSIVGGGPTGVELAGIIAELARRTLWPEFRNIDTRQARVLLLEAGPRILSAFPEDLSAYARRALEKLGVEVRLGIPVKDITQEGVTVGDEFIPCHTTVWAAGVAASPAALWLDAESDRAGRVKVLSNLSVPGHEDIFAIGDTAWVEGDDGRPVPGIAPAAKQQGNLATIGKGAAVVDMGRIRLKGTIAWWFWGIAHIFFLIGTRRRAAMAWSWLWTYITGQHSARLITQGKPSDEFR